MPLAQFTDTEYLEIISRLKSGSTLIYYGLFELWWQDGWYYEHCFQTHITDRCVSALGFLADYDSKRFLWNDPYLSENNPTSDIATRRYVQDARERNELIGAMLEKGEKIAVSHKNEAIPIELVFYITRLGECLCDIFVDGELAKTKPYSGVYSLYCAVLNS